MMSFLKLRRSWILLSVRKTNLFKIWINFDHGYVSFKSLFLVKAPQVNRRGRPKKPCQKSLSEILEKLKENICRRVRKISEKSNVRSDSRRIQLVRIARKIPLAILNIVELKSKFKTSTEKYFMEAYLNAFLMFLEIIPKESQEVYFERFLKKYGSIDWVNNKEKILKPNKYIKSYDRFPDEFYLFCKTSFPKKKIETMNSFIPQSSNNMHHNTESNEDDISCETNWTYRNSFNLKIKWILQSLCMLWLNLKNWSMFTQQGV